MEQNNGRQTTQDVQIAETKKDISWIKRELVDLKLQLINHIPTELKEIRREIKNTKDNFVQKRLTF